MTNPYDVLKVSPGAPQEVIDVAYLALRRGLPAGESDARRELEAAYDILGTEERRAEYDASHAAGDGAIAPGVLALENVAPDEIPEAAAPRPISELPEFVPAAAPGLAPATLGDPIAVPMSAAPAPPSGGGSKKLMAILAGVIFLLIAGIAAGLGYILLSGDDGGNYPLNLGDDQYNLSAMGLEQGDMPAGMAISQPVQDELAFGIVVGEGIEFGNADWAQMIDQEDPEAKARQLDALGRIRNHIRFFEAEPLRYGYPVQYSSQSTLYKDETAAIESIRTDCDTVRDPALTVNDLKIKTIGDQSTAFYVLTPTDEVGNIIETVVCFRTGRIVHSVTQQGFEGTEDLDVALGLVDTMLDRIDNSFDGS